MSALRKSASLSSSPLIDERLANTLASCRPDSAISFTRSVERINPGGVREGLGAEVVLGMKVSGDEIERLRAGEFLRDVVHGRAVARAEAGIDHERGAIVHDVAYIRHQRDAVVWDDMDMRGDLPEPLDLDDRRRRCLHHKRRHRPDECQCQDDDPHGRTHVAFRSLRSVYPAERGKKAGPTCPARFCLAVRAAPSSPWA